MNSISQTVNSKNAQTHDFCRFYLSHTKCMSNWIEMCISWKLIVLFVQVMKPFHPNYWKHESQSKNHSNSQLPKCPFFRCQGKLASKCISLVKADENYTWNDTEKNSILNLLKRVYISINLTPNWIPIGRTYLLQKKSIYRFKFSYASCCAHTHAQLKSNGQ